MLRNFLRDEEGMGTVEMVLIIAALVTIAIIFRNAITSFVRDQLGSVFKSGTDASTVTEAVAGAAESAASGE